MTDPSSATWRWAEQAVPSAVAYARALLGAAQRQRAEDVVQQALCNLLARAARYDLSADGRKLLFAAVSNACLNARTRRRELASLDGRLPDGQWTQPAVAADPADEPLARVLSAERAERIERALAELPGLQRAVMALRAVGQSPGEIAGALSLSPGHVAVLTHRARRTLAESLADLLREDA